MLHVTKSFLPELKEYVSLLEEIWSKGQLTNDGPLVLELERKLAEYLEVEHFLYVSNGTIALQLAIKALGLILRNNNFINLGKMQPDFC
jgi:dTDP-4-amino-4,6-dideoxygalactose transaminase